MCGNPLTNRDTITDCRGILRRRSAVQCHVPVVTSSWEASTLRSFLNIPYSLRILQEFSFAFRAELLLPVAQIGLVVGCARRLLLSSLLISSSPKLINVTGEAGLPWDYLSIMKDKVIYANCIQYGFPSQEKTHRSVTL